MSVNAYVGLGIAFDYRATGEVLCRNPNGLIFFLRADPPTLRPSAPAPSPRSWQPVEATQEVEVRRHVDPQPIREAVRAVPQGDAHVSFMAVESMHEVEVRRSVPAADPAAGTGPLPGAPAPGAQATTGWFAKLFKK